jgi:putative heme-binding domain-containing protein
VGPSALAVERILTRFQPVQGWKVMGPFPRTTPLPFRDSSAIDFSKNQVGAEGQVIGWKARAADPATGRVVIDDLKAGAGDKGGFGFDANGSPDLSAFAYTEIRSDRDRPALLLVGSSGSILITVNNQPVLHSVNAAGRPYATDSNTARVTLKKGVNRILVQTRQGMGTWSFGMLVSDPTSTILAGSGTSIGAEGLRAFALSHQGDPVNGERIFFEEKGLGCVRCHAVGGKGNANIGPDLTGLANKYQKAEIIRSVIEPSSRLATGYQPLLIAKRDGTVVAGILRSETEDFVELIDAEGKFLRIAKVEIDQRQVSDSSLMPAGLADFLSPVEFADLIAYLGSLKSGKSRD